MIVIVMGVTGVGKTTIGRLLARELGCDFFDADYYHPAANVAKMRSGVPLTDDDRLPWLMRLNALLRQHVAAGKCAVLGCSALKQQYREHLAAGLADLRLVYLRGAKPLIASRLAARSGHFMNPALLYSQFAALEEPSDAIVADIDTSAEALVAAILTRLG